MPADKFGRYLISDTYREQVSAAVKKAIRNLEEHGIAPVYVARKPKDTSLSECLCVRHKLMAKEPRYATQTQG
ncbi:hypothetical protein, partial [Burkholderia stagnalis]|uniref:hypothetical protein n=1 Tax=Burkholderia stagnalis TaxID=1503054 RepID=UPI000AA467EE